MPPVVSLSIPTRKPSLSIKEQHKTESLAWYGVLIESGFVELTGTQRQEKYRRSSTKIEEVKVAENLMKVVPFCAYEVSAKLDVCR